MSKSKLAEVTDENFDEVVRRATVPVVVDFWAPWCRPCKAVTPVLEKMAEKYKGLVKIVSMNVDGQKRKPAEYAVRSIPTLLFFKDGSIKDQMIGALTEENIEHAIKSLL